MPKSFRLSRNAEKQIYEIAEYTDGVFGERQTEAYLEGLVASFELLVRFPGIGAVAYEIKQGWRRYRYQSHYIFYSDQAEFVLIENVIHVRRNIRRDLFDI